MIKVYHKNRMNNDKTLDGTTLVAEVDTTDLEYAFKLTNHLDKAWWENDGVRLIGEETRSSSMGDILVIGDAHYIVTMFGFNKIN